MTSAALHSAQQQQEQKAVEEAQEREAFAQKAELLKDVPSLQPAAQPPQRAPSCQKKLSRPPHTCDFNRLKQAVQFLKSSLTLKSPAWAAWY